MSRLERLRELHSKASASRPLVDDLSEEARAARSLAWLLFDRRAELLELLETAEESGA